jgi:hypothetical protein
MSFPILISATEGDWDRLTSNSGIPETLFSKEPDSATDVTEAPFLFCGEIPENPELLTAEELERLDQFLFACREGRFLHLHHCTGSVDQEWERIKAISVAWSRLAGERKRRYESYIRPVLVIIGGDTTIGGESDFRKLLELLCSRREELAFRDFYLMSPRLEPSGKEIFHARTVWPIGVGRLLILLSSLPIDSQPGQVYGWRFTEYRHLEPEILYRDLVPACSDDVFEQLRGTGSDPFLPSIDPIITATKWEDAESKPHPAWNRFSSTKESLTATDAALRKNRLTKASSSDLSVRATESLRQWQSREESLIGFWKTVHQQPGSAWKGLAILDRVEKSNMAGLCDIADKETAGFMGQIKNIESEVDAFTACASELAEAQVWFVSRPWRFAISVVAASFLGILFFRATQLVFDNPVVSIVTASICFVGAFIGAGMLFMLENHGGENGAQEWGRNFTKYEGSLDKLNQQFCGWKNDASRVNATFLRVTLNSRIRRMLNRVVNTVTFSFQNLHSPIHSREDDAPTALRYLECSTVQFTENTKLSEESREDLIHHAVYLLRNSTFLKELGAVWCSVWEMTDPLSVGAVSITKLQSAISSQLALLPGLVDTLISGKKDAATIIGELKVAVGRDGLKHGDLFSVEVSDIAEVTFRKYRLVAAKYASELSGEDFLTMPNGAEAIAPFLLVEISPIRFGSKDLTTISSGTGVTA